MLPYVNPFPNDPDRSQIWEMLVERDIEAFVAADWSMVAGDFVEEEFFGIDGGKSHNPDGWKLGFPDLESYRKRWLGDAVTMGKMASDNASRIGSYQATTLLDIEIEGDRAIAHKKFNGEVALENGDSDTLFWQTLYVCKRINGRWKIASFVGYIPYDLGQR